MALLLVALLVGVALAFLVGTLVWLRHGFERRHAHGDLTQREAVRAAGIEAARARGHRVVGPTIDQWTYSCEVHGCLGTVGVVEDHHGLRHAGTAVEHDCPTDVPTDWDDPTHHRHGGPLHDH